MQNERRRVIQGCGFRPIASSLRATRECEAGNETYARNKQAIGNVPGNQGTETDEQGKEQSP